MSASQQVVIAQLMNLKLRGVDLTNFQEAIGKIVDALLYLVQNTPEVKR
jgi:hypothetical protein